MQSTNARGDAVTDTRAPTFLEYDTEYESLFAGVQVLARRTATILLALLMLLRRCMMEDRQKILVIEPNGDWRDLINFVLAGCGYEIINAKAGPNTVDQAAALKPDLILLDLELEQADGQPILPQLKTNPLTRAIPVVAEIVRGEDHRAREAVCAGADAVLYRPYDLGDLPILLQQKLRHKRA